MAVSSMLCSVLAQGLAGACLQVDGLDRSEVGEDGGERHSQLSLHLGHLEVICFPQG